MLAQTLKAERKYWSVYLVCSLIPDPIPSFSMLYTAEKIGSLGRGYLVGIFTHAGRWWIIGSAWVGRDTNSTPSAQQGAASGGGPGNIDTAAAASESWVLELARRQRMNTDVRKNIFCVVMTSEVHV